MPFPKSILRTRLPLLLRQVLYNLRGGFLLRPLFIALTLGAAGALLSQLEEIAPVLSGWVPHGLFPSRADPQVAQVILGTIGASIMTVVSIVFAILLMTLTLASMQFSPRIIIGFARDHVTQWTLGIFLGTFCYCMAALPAARSLPRPFAPVATVVGAMLLALACVGWLLFFIHHISRAISVNEIVDKIASETEGVIDQMMPWPHRPGRVPDDGQLDTSAWDTVITSDSSGYIRFVYLERLVTLAKSYKVKVAAVRRIGNFVPAGVPLLRLHKGERLPPDSRSLADLAAGHRVRGAADRRHRAQGHLAGGQRPLDRHQLRGSAEPHPDPLRRQAGPELGLLRPAGSGAGHPSRDRLRTPARFRLRADPPLFDRGRGGQPPPAARPGRHCHHQRGRGLPPHPRRARSAHRRRLRRPTRRTRAGAPPRPPGRARGARRALGAVRPAPFRHQARQRSPRSNQARRRHGSIEALCNHDPRTPLRLWLGRSSLGELR
jgi:hypothetical protein